MKNILRCMIFAVVALCVTNAQAAVKTQTITVNATVPTMADGLTVGISKVVGDVWTAGQTTISFGTLVWNPTNKIFLPDCYFAVDLGVQDNTGSNWTITHTRTSLANGSNNLNDKVNVSFAKQTTSKVGTELSKYSLGDSNNKTFTKAELAGGWLRIYYGIGTGSGDATGVTPIGVDTPAGTYTGSVTITLTP